MVTMIFALKARAPFDSTTLCDAGELTMTEAVVPIKELG
jgi:hypothetical protein